jgi:hypothetical protein
LTILARRNPYVFESFQHFLKEYLENQTIKNIRGNKSIWQQGWVIYDKLEGIAVTLKKK